MTEKQADHLLEMLDRIATAVEYLAQMREREAKRTPGGLWRRDLPRREKPPEAEL